jgi:nitroreductase
VEEGLAQIAWSLITARRSVLPKRLTSPGPSAAQRQQLFELAAAAPDHGQLVPWRLIVVPREQRHRLGEVFALALTDRDPHASPQQIESAREKAHRAPLLVVAVARLASTSPEIPALERMVSLGAAVQNMLLGAQAMGFGAGLTSGKAMASARMSQLLGLGDGDVAVCCVNIGTVAESRTRTRLRPQPQEFVSTLGCANQPMGTDVSAAGTPLEDPMSRAEPATA